MSIRTRARRLTHLLHRWSGLAGCVLMLLWFVSGIVMLYVGYPKLTPWERLGALPTLQADCCAPLAALPASTTAPGAVTLTGIRGEPHYVVGLGPSMRVFTADTGAAVARVDTQQALAAARAFAPGAGVRHDDEIDGDRWTRSGRLNPHRPLHRVQLDGETRGTLYVSSLTGEVVLDAPLLQQRLNYIGAWLHWLYLFRFDAIDPRWSWIVIALSAMGTVTAVSGIVVGLWRWRFRKRYASGSHTPYREAWMRWHHILGLGFSAFIFAWIFSGLMSMNPLGIFSTPDSTPDLAAYRGSAQRVPDPLAEPRAVLHALRTTGFDAVELHWRQFERHVYVLAHDAQAERRIVRHAHGRLQVLAHWPAESVLAAAQHLFAHPLRSHAVIDDYDAYYVQRHPESMNGANQYGLPALRLEFDNPARSRVYIDLQTGEVARSLARSQRAGRWLFDFLHSWDTPGLLRGGLVREIAIIALSLGGIAVSLSGIVIGWRRLRSASTPRKPRRTEPRSGGIPGRQSSSGMSK